MYLTAGRQSDFISWLRPKCDLASWLWPDRRIGTLNLLHFCNDGFQASFLLLLPFIAAALGFTTLQIGYLTSAQFLLGVLVAIPAGKAAGRLGGHVILLVGMVVYAASFFAIVLAGDFSLFMLVYLLAGIGYGLFHPVAFGLVARHCQPHKSGTTMGIFTAVGDVGRIAISGAALIMLPLVGWQQVSPAVGLVALLMAAIVAAVVLRNGKPRKQARTSDRAETPATSLSTLSVLTTYRSFTGVCLIGFADALANSTLFVFLPLMLAYKQMDRQFVGISVTAFLVANLAGKLLIGNLADRLGNKLILISCELGIFASAFGLCASSNRYLLLVFAICLGAFSKGTLPILLSMSAKRLPEHALQIGFGINQTLLGVATVLSPLLLGFVSNLATTQTAFRVVGMICLGIATLLVCDRGHSPSRLHR